MSSHTNEMTMVERVKAALARTDVDYDPDWDYTPMALAAIEAMKSPGNEILEAMWTAMFVGRFTGSELPMLGAGFEAAIDAALQENPK